MSDKWYRRLTRGKKGLSRYAYEANYWPSCALSEHDPQVRVPRVVDFFQGGVAHVHAEPKDPTLRRLGLDFHQAILLNQRSRALRLYQAIGARVQTLQRRA